MAELAMLFCAIVFVQSYRSKNVMWLTHRHTVQLYGYHFMSNYVQNVTEISAEQWFPSSSHMKNRVCGKVSQMTASKSHN